MVWFGVGRSCLHCQPLVGFLKPHLVGDGEKNGGTRVSPPWTRCPKPLCSGHLHIAVWARVGQFFPPHCLLRLPGTGLGFKSPCLKGSHSMHPSFRVVPLCTASQHRASGSSQYRDGASRVVCPAPQSPAPPRYSDGIQNPTSSNVSNF